MKKNKGLIILLIIFIILTLALGGYIVYDKLLKNKEPENKETEVIEDEKENNSTLVSKLYDDREWIYDAEYDNNVNVSSYTTTYSDTYYSKDIIVPFINIDSEYAKNANNEIKNVFSKAIDTYNKGTQDKESYVDECNYKNYISDKLLSVLVTLGVGGTDIVNPDYYTYNIDLKTGNKMSYEDVYKLAGFDSTNINSKVEEAITRTMKEKISNFALDSETDFDIYNNESINNYKKSLNDNRLKYFISEDDKLNVIVTLNIPVGREEFDTIIPID